MIKEIGDTLPQIDSLSKAQALGRGLRKRWSDERIEEIVRRLGTKAEVAASSAWRVLKEGVLVVEDAPTKKRRKRYSSADLVGKWTREAVALITSVRDEVAEGLRQDIVEALEKGHAADVLQAKWTKQGIPVAFGTLEGRVAVIAQHQLSMLHARVQSERARSVGIEEFVWKTQGDGRVRDAHRALEGKVFSYENPPPEGLPGEPVRCRCYAESVIPDEFAEQFGITVRRR